MSKIICFGDSLTACGGINGRYSDILQDRFPNQWFINKGVGGETFVDALLRLEADVLTESPDIVLVEFGANDWSQAKRPYTDWAEDLRYIITRISEKNAHVIVLGVFGPALDAAGNRCAKETGTDYRAQAYHELKSAIAEELNCDYIGNIQETILNDKCYWLDPCHPNELGNRRVADTIEPILERLLGQTSLPMRKSTLHTLEQVWVEAVELAPDHLAVVDGDQRQTYRQADQVIQQIAQNLLTVHKEHDANEPLKVMVSLPNCIEYYWLYWAIARIGGVIVPINTWLRQDSLRAILARVRPQCIVFDQTDEHAINEVLSQEQIDFTCATFARKQINEQYKSFAALLEAGTNSTREADNLANSPLQSKPDDMAIIMHTSGTTAMPKGAVMRHCDIRFNVSAAINAHKFTPEDRHLLVNPMFHCTALYTQLPLAAYQKTPLIIAQSADTEHLLQLAETESITTVLSVPTVFQRIVQVQKAAPRNLPSLRLFAYAGSMMPVPTIKELDTCFPNVLLHNFFGLTETISMTHVLPSKDALERSDSIGRLIFGVKAKVIDEQKKEVKNGETGELVFARNNVISTYYKDFERLAKNITTIDGNQWFCTGDLASVDEQGYFYLRGRKKDMIIVGGENVFASEVETVLLELSHVKEAAVKGIPATGVRKSLGEMICAYVVLENDDLSVRDVRKHCHDRLPSYKIPHEVIFLDALPRNPSGKVVKNEL